MIHITFCFTLNTFFLTFLKLIFLLGDENIEAVMILLKLNEKQEGNKIYALKWRIQIDA